jgi:hypothetical protein
MHGRDEKCIKILARKTEGKKPLGTPGHRGENNIRILEWILGK